MTINGGDMDGDICNLTIQELNNLYRAGKASPIDAVKAVLKRIELLDPSVNAFCQIAA